MGSGVIAILLTLMAVVAEMQIEGLTDFTRLDFPPPPNFVFGSGSSAYQVLLQSYMFFDTHFNIFIKYNCIIGFSMVCPWSHTKHQN